MTSWAIVDYFLRPKAAYFTIKRELRPYTVGMARKERTTHADELSAAKATIETTLEIWGTNSTLEEKTAVLEVTAFNLHSGATESWKQDVRLAPNAATELWAGLVPGQPPRTKLSEVPETIVVSARLLDEAGAVLGRYSNWCVFQAVAADCGTECVHCRPEPFKYIHFPDVKEVGLHVEVGADGESVTLSCAKPIKGIVLDVEGEEVQWGDQAIDLVPGDPQVIAAVGLKGRAVKTRFLGDGTA